MLVTIAPMIAKNKLRDLCRGAIFPFYKKKTFPPATGWDRPPSSSAHSDYGFYFNA
jgi:hypothetical protein